MPKALTLSLLLAFYFTTAQSNAQLQSSYYVQQNESATGIQLHIPIVVKQQAKPHYIFDTLLSLTPTKGYDADKQKQSVFIKEIHIYTDSIGEEKTKIIGKLDLNCCFDVIARVELQDRVGNTLVTSNTDEDGEFAIIGHHGKLLSEDRKSLTLHFGRLAILDLSGNQHEYQIKKIL